MKKIVNLLIIILIIFYIATPVSNADGGFNEIFSKGQQFIEKGQSGEEVINYDEMNKTKDEVYNIFLAIGVVTSVIVGAILGISFMLASVEGKAEIKQKLYAYVAGCVLVFGAFTIWKIVLLVLGDIK